MYFNLAGAFVCIILMQSFAQLTNYLGTKEAFYLQRKISHILYEHVLSLKTDTSSKKTTGEIIALYTTDVSSATFFLEQTLPMGASTIFPLILAPLVIQQMFGISAWLIVAMIVVITGIFTFLAFRQSKFFSKFKQLAADRLAIVNEWIQNIRTLRILAWTEVFEQKIFEKRKIETINRIHMVTNGQVMNTLSTTVTFAINLVALSILIFLHDHTPTAGDLFALLWILGLFLIRPFRQMPWFFTFGFDSWTSLQRLQSFLNIQNPKSSFEFSKTDTSVLPVEILEKPAIEIESLNLTEDGTHILKDINFSVRKNEFICIVGEVGSGKSLLLLSLLAETQASFKKYNLFGASINDFSHALFLQVYSYVPQDAFLISTTLKNNLSMTYETSLSDDLALHHLAQSEFDVLNERMPDQLLTQIGERGVNLSGGQRQRINLARAHHKDAKIILLDDSLSAVDQKTEVKLIQSLIKNQWKDKTIILVTHRLSVLPSADRVLFLDDGAIAGFDTYEHLYTTHANFRRFISEKK